jgi:hypothetical protein
MLPVFLPIALAQKILVIGKTNNFLKICLPKLTQASSMNKGSTVSGGGGNPNIPSKVSSISPVKTSSSSGVRSPLPSYREMNKAKKLTTGARVVDTSDHSSNGHLQQSNDTLDPAEYSLLNINKKV